MYRLVVLECRGGAAAGAPPHPASPGATFACGRCVPAVPGLPPLDINTQKRAGVNTDGRLNAC